MPQDSPAYDWFRLCFHSQEWSMSNFPYSLTRNITSHSVKNVAFHSLLRWKMIILPIPTASLIHGEECTLWTWELRCAPRPPLTGCRPWFPGLVLGSFFYGYWILQIPGACLAMRIGGTRVFGYGVLLTSLLALLTPIAARYHVMALIGVRIFQGLFLVSGVRPGRSPSYPHQIIGQEWSIPNSPCSLTRNITSYSMNNLAFHSLLR